MSTTHYITYFTGKNTFFGEAATLLQATGEVRSNLDKMLITIILVLTGLSLTLCGIAFYYLYKIREIDLVESLSFTVVLIVASIPLAIEIVCTTTLALGSRQMAKYGMYSMRHV